jgi:pimeloyl-ACP methyl ester carboxylesterase
MVRFDDIVGRYLYLSVEDVEYRVYFEENGAGIPLLCQHTAGSDGRQYRHLLEDREISKDYRLIACDLPYHGKSIPPVGKKWWQEEYRLEKEFFMKFIVAFSKALELDNPVFMGSSMGGHLAPDLALHYPGAVILRPISRSIIPTNSGPSSGSSRPSPRRVFIWIGSTIRGSATISRQASCTG